MSKANPGDAAADNEDVGELLREAVGLEGKEVAALGEGFEHGPLSLGDFERDGNGMG